MSSLPERIRSRLKAYDQRLIAQSMTDVVDAQKVSQHVVPHHSGGWAVRRSGSSRASKVFENQVDAVTYAKLLARKEGAELYVHRSDGTIAERDSYDADTLALATEH